MPILCVATVWIGARYALSGAASLGDGRGSISSRAARWNLAMSAALILKLKRQLQRMSGLRGLASPNWL